MRKNFTVYGLPAAIPKGGLPAQSADIIWKIMKISMVQITLAMIFTGTMMAKEDPWPETDKFVAITVTGKVTDPNGMTIPGVGILVKGTNTGTVTDVEGNYSINVPDADAILIFSSIGYVTQEIAVNGRTVIDVSLVEDVRARAYWQTDRNDIVTALSGLTEQQFVEEVWKERLRELPMEYRTWSDIQRTRLYPVTSTTSPGEVSFVNVIGHSNNWGKTFQEHHLLIPIPLNELNRNPELTQNPGY